MSEPTSSNDKQVHQHEYSSTTGINYDSVPWRLWERSKQLFWDPATLDLSTDRESWASMTKDEQLMIARSARGFMVGEEAVTLDILPLLRAMSDEGRLEDTMYLSMFAMEEAKHVDFFRRWFDAVGFDPRLIDEADREQGQSNGQTDQAGLFGGSLTKVMRRLDNDRSPKNILNASLLYNHLVEGVAAIAGYRNWDAMLKAVGEDRLPGIKRGLQLIQRDERRHIAYGTYLCRRIIAEHPDTWEYVEQQWHKMTGGILLRPAEEQSANGNGNGYGAYGGPLFRDLAQRRLEALAVARQQQLTQVEGTQVEEFEPVES